MHRRKSGERRLVLIIDYLQKVPQIPEPPSETEKVTFVVNGLKDIALTEKVPTIAIVAADKEGLKAARLRNHHLRGSSAINYEADVILILNEKYQIVAKVNIEFNPYQAQRFRDWIIASVEKNRIRRRQPRHRVPQALRLLVLRPDGPPRAGEADRGAPLQRLAAAVMRRIAALPTSASLAHALLKCARSRSPRRRLALRSPDGGVVP